MSVFFFVYCKGFHRDLHGRTHSFPTRRASDPQAGVLPVDGHEPADEQALPPPAAADAVLLQRALARLTANTRGVLWLYHAEGYTHEEIAALMPRTPSFSKSQLAREIGRAHV